mgnify:CR=1 FL=1
MYTRNQTRVISIGDVKIGGGNPVAIQSMTNTKTENVEETVKQILALEKAGCQIIRCTVPTMKAAEAFTEIKKQIHIPLVADIHFDYKLAIAAMEHGQIRSVSIRGISVEKRIFVSGRNSKEISCTDPRWCKQRIIGETTC